MTDMVNHPRHYNAHPSGIECIDIVERMTFNLGNATKYLWRGGLKLEIPIEDYRKSLWYVTRAYTHDQAQPFNDRQVEAFKEFMADKVHRLLARPSPWCEPVRQSIGYLIDLHYGWPVATRIDIFGRLMRCVGTAIEDEACIGRGTQP